LFLLELITFKALWLPKIVRELYSVMYWLMRMSFTSKSTLSEALSVCDNKQFDLGDISF